MATDLLITAGASVTGKWVRTEPPSGKKTWPFRFMITGDYDGENVYIEEGIGGLPGFGTSSPYIPQSDTFAVVRIIQTVPPGGADVQIDAPIEFLRARTGALSSGHASVRLLEAA